MADKKEEQYSPLEAKRRLEAALRGARVAGPKPRKTIVPKPPTIARKKEKR